MWPTIWAIVYILKFILVVRFCIISWNWLYICIICCFSMLFIAHLRQVLKSADAIVQHQCMPSRKLIASYSTGWSSIVVQYAVAEQEDGKSLTSVLTARHWRQKVDGNILSMSPSPVWTSSSWHLLLLTPCTPAVTGWAHCWVFISISATHSNVDGWIPTDIGASHWRTPR